MLSQEKTERHSGVAACLDSDIAVCILVL